MPRYALTGSPGAGKTTILRYLERAGYRVVEEAATDVIALEQALGRPEPSTRPEFIDDILRLQRQRERLAPAAGLVFFDRSPVCTLALSRFLGYPPSPQLVAEADRVVAERTYGEAVFFVRNQGFVEPTSARRISLAESLAFEEVHDQTYRELGFRLIDVPPGPLTERAELVRREASRLAAAVAAVAAAAGTGRTAGTARTAGTGRTAGVPSG